MKLIEADWWMSFGALKFQSFLRQIFYVFAELNYSIFDENKFDLKHHFCAHKNFFLRILQEQRSRLPRKYVFQRWNGE